MSIESKKKSAIPELSVEARLMANRFAKLAENEVVNYAELSELIGQDVRNSCRHKLQTAMRRVQADQGFVLACVPSVGVKRLTNVGIVDAVADGTEKIHRASGRMIKKAACVVLSELPREKVTEFNARVSVLGALRHNSGAAAGRKILKAVETTQQQLPLAKTLEAFV